MKKILLAALFTGFSMATFAQEQTLDYMNEGVLHVNPFGAGYIAGTNGYGDQGKYQRFDLTTPISLNAVTVFMGHKEIIGAPDVVFLVVRSKKDSVPDDYITSVELKLDQFADPGLPTRIEMPGPIAFSALDSFFVGLEWNPVGDDQFAILADKNGQGDLAHRSWEQYDIGTYHSFNENSNNSWKLDADLHIQLNFSATSGTENLQNSAFSALAVQPNPAAEVAIFSFEMKKAGEAIFDILDLQGRLVKSLGSENLPLGPCQKRLETSGLADGFYVARLRSNGESATQLFSVKR